MIKHTLAALALTAAVAQPAQANDDFGKLLVGIIGAVLIDKFNTPAHHGYVNDHTVVMPQHNPHNSPALPGYARGLDNPNRVCTTETERRSQVVIIRELNCYGEILSVRRQPRY